MRTDSEPTKRQEGISFLLIDMRSPGITVRPIMLMDGGHEVNEVFFDDVQVPLENRVHEENKGWTVAKYLLGYERMGTGRIGASKRELARLKELAAKTTKDGRPLLDDPRFRDRMTRVEVELMALEITNLRFLDQLRGGRAPGAEVSLLKIKGTEIQQSALGADDADGRALRAALPPGGRKPTSTASPRRWRRATATCARPPSTRGPTRSSATSSPRRPWASNGSISAEDT